MKIKWVQAGALILIVLGSLSASIQNLVSTRDLGSTSDDPVADWEKRFEPLKKQLPFVRGVVGYISDSSIPGVSFDSANDQGEYVLAQYVLAPISHCQGHGSRVERRKPWKNCLRGVEQIQPRRV